MYQPIHLKKEKIMIYLMQIDLLISDLFIISRCNFNVALVGSKLPAKKY